MVRMNLRRTARPILFCIFLSSFLMGTSHAVPNQLDSGHFPADPKAQFQQDAEVTVTTDADVNFLTNEETVSFDDAGNAMRSRYFRYRILTEKGAREWASIAVLWQPWLGKRPVLRARVITPDFVVHELDEKTITESPASQGDADIFSDARVVRAPLPAVAPGAIVEEEVRTEENITFAGAGMVERFYFASSVPVQHARFTVEFPEQMPIRYSLRFLPEMKPERSEEMGRVHIVFERGAANAIEDIEPDTPYDDTIYPSVTISSGASWQELATQYSALIDKQIDLRKMAGIVNGLVRDKKTQEEKITSVVSYLSRQVRYTGVEFGDASIFPRPPEETLNRKYGDCKDKSALLVAMLRSIGVSAYIALLRVGDREDLSSDLPGMDMFNHAIVYIAGSKELWIDATDDHARVGELPIADQDRFALIIRPQSSALVRTPLGTSTVNLLLEKRKIRLSEYGGAQVTEISQPHGTDESTYRRLYADTENKNTKEHLGNYFENQYLADKLDHIEHTDPDDLSTQFELTLMSERAGRGNTDLDSAVVAIRFEGLFSRLPAELKEKEGNQGNSKDATKKKRIHDYLLPEPFVTEWQYTIVPPLGYRPKPLPQNAEFGLGPAKLFENFDSDQDGTVHATLRFDTVKRRLTSAEGAELRDKAIQLMEGQPILIYFQPIGQTLIADGKPKDADQSYRDLIASHPKEAVLHLQLADMLLAFGLGEAARGEAQSAVRLEPDSALAQKKLAYVLEHDLVGRRFRPGSDFKGAEAALRTAEKLDPKDDETVADLAILLEYNSWGLRYGQGARLKEAIEEYRKLTPEELARINIENNLPYTLYYAREFEEAEHIAIELNSPPVALIVACEAAQRGSKAALDEARKRSNGDTQFKQFAENAGRLLANLRMYSLAADLEDAGASGDDASDTAAYAALYRTTQPHENLLLNNDPSGVALRYELLSNDVDITVEKLAALCSKNGKLAFAVSTEVENLAKEQKREIVEKAREGQFPEVGIDLMMTRAQPTVTGNDETGYKVTLYPAARYKSTRYVVKEGGQYKLLAISEYPAPIGLEVLDRVAVNDLVGARTLLNWFRDDRRLNNADDPLAGWEFARFWAKGRNADAAAMKTAAALILTSFKDTALQGIAILEKTNDSALTEADRTNILLGLVTGYDRLKQYGKALESAKVLEAEFPESERAFAILGGNLRELGDWAEVSKLSNERLERIPDDAAALRMLSYDASDRGDYAGYLSWTQKILDQGKAEAEDLNNFAWASLFANKVDSGAVQDALKATQLSNEAPGYMHTLGCIYIEVGKAKEASQVLLRSMDLLNLDQPDDNYWYALGRIAEQLGERETAMTNYARVTKPDDTLDFSLSTYKLAQLRLQELGASKPSGSKL
jgi:transglutaminase-like putative cysteine protease/Flp pilus assembly protein TadD